MLERRRCLSQGPCTPTQVTGNVRGTQGCDPPSAHRGSACSSTPQPRRPRSSHRGALPSAPSGADTASHPCLVVSSAIKGGNNLPSVTQAFKGGI